MSPMFRIGVPRNSTAMSDIYSFGVFLLELITGQEAVHLGFLGSDESLIQWVRKSTTFACFTHLFNFHLGSCL